MHAVTSTSFSNGSGGLFLKRVIPTESTVSWASGTRVSMIYGAIKVVFISKASDNMSMKSRVGVYYRRFSKNKQNGCHAYIFLLYTLRPHGYQKLAKVDRKIFCRLVKSKYWYFAQHNRLKRFFRGRWKRIFAQLFHSSGLVSLVSMVQHGPNKLLISAEDT